ncbi:MAG: DUF58 domain-containing protein [Methylococcales bacterium]|nr:DUF58 domain-containing protein [Methylococcales bacterium]
MTLKERFRLSRFYRGEKATDKPVILNHRRIFILPTHRGFNFAILIALILLIAFVYNNNLAYLLAFLLASIFFISILHSYKSLAGLILEKGQSKRVFAGEAVGFKVNISNPLDIERYNLQITLQDSKGLTIKAQNKACMTLYSSTQRRGWHTAGTVTISSTYPLGLFRAWSPVQFNFKELVYPKPSKLELPFPENSSSETLQGFRQKGADDFYGLREYQSSDSIKQIHWKTFAKGQGVFSKVYSGESSTEIWLNYGHTPGHDTEQRLSQLCRWVLDAESIGVRYGFSLPGFELSPDNSLSHTKKCLEALALF